MDLPDLDRIVEALRSTTWYELGIALAFHAASILVRGVAWRNIVADDFPEAHVPTRGIIGAYAAGVGLNSILPARLGEAMKLFIAKRQVPEASYPALISTLFVFALGDAIIGVGFVAWAAWAGTIPGSEELFADPGAVGGWVLDHPGPSAAVGAVLATGLVAMLVLAHRRLDRLKAGFLRGLAVLRDWPFYPLHVLSWQGLGWALQLASFWWFLRAWQLPASIHDAAVVQAIASLSSTIPFTASGAGAEQAMLVVVWEGRFDEADLIGFAFGMRATTIALNLLVGLAAMVVLLRTLRLRRLVRLEHELVEHLRLGFVRRLTPARRRRDS